ncbi:Fur family transcriptional regulator [Legionella dresdenensis]|uniref:Fur family transcriptional regulator n=1 Tax=Legionella dresdenensis TaxID=450200 RepID=A0ABV8CCT0_9GAMM
MAFPLSLNNAAYPAEFIAFCKLLDYRLTSLRKRILYILWSSDKPLKAYQILSQLHLTQENSKPPTVYRVLDYLVECKLIHKIESIQSYVLCRKPDEHPVSEILLVCNACHRILEACDKHIHNLLKQLGLNNNFNIEKNAIELKGYCNHCHA